MKKYYARFKSGFCSYWVIYKKRKWFFDKKVCKFYTKISTERKKFRETVEPELDRLERENL